MTEYPHRRNVIAALSAAGLATAARARSSTPALARVNTASGPVQGSAANGLVVFKGIPYGADTGPRRFQAPALPEPWTHPRDCTRFGAACPQPGAEADQAEDCLVLNIFTPRCDDARRPVMFYIHGGAYMTGSGSDPLYDGSRLAVDEDVVVVTINHRLNAFGYLYLARLERQLTGSQTRFAVSGNAGQLDLVLALRWVSANIAGFGGDPSRVMLFGQSGGGAKIATLMAQPAAVGLFHRAATMSGQQVTASGPGNATKRTETCLQSLGLKPDQAGLDALPTVPVTDLVAALKTTDPVIGSGGLYMGPVVDQAALFRHPFYPDAAPQSLHIPMIIGNVHDETRYFLRNDPTVYTLTWDDLPARLPSQYRIDIDPWLVIATYRRLYPAMTPSEVFFAATTAGRSWRGAIIEDEERARAGAPAFAYQLDWRSPIDNGRWGACHTMDIPLVFKTTGAPGALSGDDSDARAMSAVMSHAFAGFARTGSPQTDVLPPWKPYSLENRETMIFDLPPRLANDPRGEERKLFAQAPFIQQGT